VLYKLLITITLYTSVGAHINIYIFKYYKYRWVRNSLVVSELERPEVRITARVDKCFAISAPSARANYMYMLS